MIRGISCSFQLIDVFRTSLNSGFRRETSRRKSKKKTKSVSGCLFLINCKVHERKYLFLNSNLSIATISRKLICDSPSSMTLINDRVILLALNYHIPHKTYISLYEEKSDQIVLNLCKWNCAFVYIYWPLHPKLLPNFDSKSCSSKEDWSTIMENESPSKKNMPPSCGTLVTILSLDGGGVRGIIAGVILAYLEKQLQVYIYINFSRMQVTKIVDTYDRIITRHANFVVVKSLHRFMITNSY